MFNFFRKKKAGDHTTCKKQIERIRCTDYISIDDLIGHLQRMLIFADGSYTSELAFVCRKHCLELLEKEKAEGSYIPIQMTWWEEEDQEDYEDQ